MARILVTGGAGFIGSHVAACLLKDQHQVHVLDDLSGGFKENLPIGVEFIQGSILDQKLLKKLFEECKFEYVFHLAAYAAEGLSHFIKRFNYENNLIGSINLINLSILYQIKCFVFTSSIAVYGKGRLPLVESLKPEPEDSYGIAKFSVEQELKISHDIFGLPYIIFRPHNVYGECQNIGDKYRNVVGIFMNQILQNKPMTIFGNGEQKRAFSYIGDVSPIIARSINIPEAYCGIFNIGADSPITVNTLARKVAKVFGIVPNIIYLDRRNEVDEAYSDHQKAKEILKAEVKTSLQEGLSKMAYWVRQRGAQKSKEFHQIEVNSKLPPSWATIQK